MNAAIFAQDLTTLLIKWTTPSAKETDTDYLIPPLTNQQVLSTIQDVVRIILGVDLQPADYSSVKTPSTGIAVCTPSAPTMPKANDQETNANLARYRSLDTLTMANSKIEEKKDAANPPAEAAHLLPDEKKFISRSSPAIHINNVSRSDTFVKEKLEKQEMKQNCDNFDKSASDFLDTDLVGDVDIMHKSAMEILWRCENIKKKIHPQSTKPIRRLSTIGTFPGLTRSSTMLRSIPPAKLRRYSTAIPGTPTSSKLNTTITRKEDSFTRRKSISGASIRPIQSSNLKVPSPTPRSASNLPTPVSKSSSASSSKSSKNPKYAHVQSTIPKSFSSKKKAT